jgi:anti-sigma regulatory factor (Ser/Thr protein kinase)
LGIKCQSSKIVIPGDHFYAEIAATYTGAVAQKLGFDMRDVEDIKHCTQRVVVWAIDYSLAEKEKVSIEVACEVIPEGFKVSVRDRGVPFEPSLLKGAQSKDLSGLFNIKGHMDEIRFNNLGPGGKEVLLIKFSQQGRITDLYDACALGHDQTGAEGAEPPPSRDMDFIVRAMKPDEAIEVSKCVYKGYGYTYPHVQIYYPAKLAASNRDNSMFSAVAVNGRGEVVGHCALLYKATGDAVAEMGLGVVRPEYRTAGCFTRLTAFLIDKAQADRLKGLFVRAVAVHRYSQQAAAKFALKETGLQLAYIPATVDFRRVDRPARQRVSIFLCFRYLVPAPQTTICPPVKHRDMILGLYEHLEIEPVEKAPADPDEIVFDPQSRIQIKIVNTMNYARMVIENYGKDIVREVSQNVNALCLKHMEVVSLYLDLSDPRTGPVSEQLEELGFFFSGVLPGIMPNKSDALILQYLNNVAVDYDAVQTHSAMAKKLLIYISDRHAEAKRSRLAANYSRDPAR